MIPDILLFIVSLTVLVLASDRFISAAEKIGLSFGISPFIIGVTIIAFGTSLPELATSIVSVYSGTSEIVIGNVIGSNITNILLVLGLTAIIGKEIILDFDVMDVDMPLLFASAFLLLFVIQDQNVSVFEAFLFLTGLVIFLLNSLRGDKDDDFERSKIDAKTWMMLILGGVLVYYGANYTIYAIKNISTGMGISPEIISLTAVALGTSLPEVIVSISAARRGKHAIAVGNVLGSNIFNTYAVMGIPALLGDLLIPADTLQFSAPFMIAVTVLFGLVCISRRISKWEGFAFVLFYAFYIGELMTRL